MAHPSVYVVFGGPKTASQEDQAEEVPQEGGLADLAAALQDTGELTFQASTMTTPTNSVYVIYKHVIYVYMCVIFI